MVARIPFLFFAAAVRCLGGGVRRQPQIVTDLPKEASRPCGGYADLLRSARMRRGTVAIFAYVGAEVTIGTLAVSYLMLPDRLPSMP